MAQYTFTAGDDGSTVLGGLNDNFTELYTDKIEADTTVALTNKTIDGDLNTVQDLPYTAIKSTARTGLDTKIVTGTPGDTDELVKWNVDGDIVSTDVTISTDAPTSASLDTTIPTSQAVYEAITAALETKSLFIPVASSYSATSLGVTGNYVTRTLTDTGSVYFTFKVPDNFNSFTSMKMYMIPDTTESIQWDITAYQAASGETYTTLTAQDLNVSLSVTASLLTKADIGASTNMATFLAGLAAGDTCAILFESDTANIIVVGLEFTYA